MVPLEHQKYAEICRWNEDAVQAEESAALPVLLHFSIM